MSELAKKLFEKNPDLFTLIQIGEMKEEHQKQLESFLQENEAEVSIESFIDELKRLAFEAPGRMTTASDRAEEKQSQEQQAKEEEAANPSGILQQDPAFPVNPK
jgi:hypothetical protein